MISAPFLDVARETDLAELAAMRAEQGWYVNTRLLETTLAWPGGRHVVLRRHMALDQAAGENVDGERTSASEESLGIAAAAFALAAGELGVIGNVVVRPRCQRGGLGRRVMEAALAWQREQGVRSVLLDATVAGRRLYYGLGFTPIGARSWAAHLPAVDAESTRLRARAGGLRAHLRPATELGRLAALDTAAYGGDRGALLAAMLARHVAWLYVVDDGVGDPLGYLVARREDGGAPVLRVGPWVARTPAAGAALLAELLDPTAPWRMTPGAEASALVAALPGYAPDALMLWHLAGGEVELDDLVMRLDFDRPPARPPAHRPPRRHAPHPEWCYAWLSSMTF